MLNTPDTATRAHHAFSPSTLQAREACPKYQPRSGTNEAAERGTLQHKATETQQDINDLSDEEAAAAAECLDFYEQCKARMVADWQRAVNEAAAVSGVSTPPPIVELTEAYLPVDNAGIAFRDRDGKPGRDAATTAGYIDRALVSHDRLYADIIDWKFGKWEVESADNNLQGIAYFLGLLHRYPTLKHVRVYFKQPHIEHLTHHDFYSTDADKHMLRVRTVVARAIQAAEDPEDFSKANPTVSGCLFCDLIGKCPKVAEIALQIGKKFAPLRIPAEINPSLLRDRAQASLAMKCASVIAVWCASLKTTTSNAVISGSMDMPDGYTIASRSDRVITDAKKFREIAITYLTEAEYDSLREELPPITKLEKVISDKAPRGEKTGTLKEFNQKLTDAKALDRAAPITFLRMSNAKDDKQKTNTTNT